MKTLYILKSKYRRKLFLSFLLIFFIFAAIVSFFQYSREKIFKIEKLETSLKIYNKIIKEKVVDDKLILSGSFSILERIVAQMPENDLRVTIVDKEGSVLYDSFYANISVMNNHLDRMEFKEAIKRGSGSNIRLSATTGIDYFYFTVKYDNFFVRTALPYTEDIKNMLKANLWFIYFMIIAFLITTYLLIYITDHFGRAISVLKDFAVKAGRNETISDDMIFEKNELGEIGFQIVNIYKKHKQTTLELRIEKEKLFKHLHYSKEGIAIFTQDKKLIVSNNYFVDYINFISEENLDIDFDRIFKIEEIAELNNFLAISVLRERGKIDNHKDQTYKIRIEKNGRHYYFRAIVFDDGSFEISINDITEIETSKKMKEQMTSNIAHELKTPVAAISGFMETLLANPDINKSKREQFIERTFKQSQRLASLITDLSVLNKIDDTGDVFTIQKVKIDDILKEILSDFKEKMVEKGIVVNCDIEKEVVIEGNLFLLDAIFRNFIDNSIKYGGEGITICIKNRYNDSEYCYFNYSDNGIGVGREHLSRIFERFYRVDKGRSRILGGTGLGLSIVKHAVMFHGGNIYAKQVKEELVDAKKRGIEFVFSLKKIK